MRGWMMEQDGGFTTNHSLSTYTIPPSRGTASLRYSTYCITHLQPPQHEGALSLHQLLVLLLLEIPIYTSVKVWRCEG